MSGCLSAQPILEGYIQEALSQNQERKLTQLELQKQQSKLKEAIALYMPSVAFEASYTLADGGRLIQFPVGDLLNPVYNTLNQLTESDQFPTIENVNEQFLPNRFHDTRVRLIQPVFNYDIYYGKKIQEELSEAASQAVAIQELDLIEEVKHAYYNYLMSNEQVEILEANIEAVRTLVSFNESRVRQDLVTRDELYRSEYQLQQLVADRAQAYSQVISSQAYFNFLLDRPSETAIEVDDTLIETATDESIADVIYKEQRPETLQLLAAKSAQKLNVRRTNGNQFLPSINAVADVGYQGFDYTFDDQQDYWLINFSLSWNIFSGGRKKYANQQAQVDAYIVDSQLAQLRRSIELEEVNTAAAYQAASQQMMAREKAVQAASSYFDITSRKYRQNQALLIEWTEAQTSLLQEQIAFNISKYQLLARKASWDRARAIK